MGAEKEKKTEKKVYVNDPGPCPDIPLLALNDLLAEASDLCMPFIPETWLTKKGKTSIGNKKQKTEQT